MRIIMIIGLGIISIQLSAQDVLAYYHEINAAKKQLIAKNFVAASDAYYTAFKNFKKPYARDCYNAIESAIISRDTQKLQFFLAKGISRGIQTTDLESAGLINDYVGHSFYKKIKAQEDSLSTVYSSSINVAIRAEINEMFLADQNMRSEYYNANIFKRGKIGKDWKSLNAKQVTRLIEITKKYGFPGENLIGLDRHHMHEKISTQNYSAGMPIVIFIHHYSQANPSYDDILWEEVKKGNLYNEHFATICDFEAAFGKNQYEHFGYYGLRQAPKRPNNELYNQKREKIGLVTINELKALNLVPNITKFWNRLY